MPLREKPRRALAANKATQDARQVSARDTVCACRKSHSFTHQPICQGTLYILIAMHNILLWPLLIACNHA